MELNLLINFQQIKRVLTDIFIFFLKYRIKLMEFYCWVTEHFTIANIDRISSSLGSHNTCYNGIYAVVDDLVKY